MHSPSELLKYVEQAIDETIYPAYPSSLYEPISYIMSLGGKRLRPIMLLMSAELFDGSIQEAIPAAMAIETFHNFTLIHDDIMDNAPLRRGKMTVHEKWDNNTAILSGDVMMVEANKHITRVDSTILKAALDTFNLTAQGVCEGQQLDMEFERRDNVRLEEYLDMIRLKTAVLLGGAMKLGAIVAKASDADSALIYAFGENLGIAFQLQDDILDVYGDPEKFGKQVGGDILADKKTFLRLKLEELAGSESLKLLREHSAKYTPSEKINKIKAMYDQFEVKAAAVAVMKEYLGKAFKAIEQIQVPPENKAALLLLANQLMNREN